MVTKKDCEHVLKKSYEATYLGFYSTVASAFIFPPAAPTLLVGTIGSVVVNVASSIVRDYFASDDETDAERTLSNAEPVVSAAAEQNLSDSIEELEIAEQAERETVANDSSDNTNSILNTANESVNSIRENAERQERSRRNQLIQQSIAISRIERIQSELDNLIATQEVMQEQIRRSEQVEFMLINQQFTIMNNRTQILMQRERQTLESDLTMQRRFTRQANIRDVEKVWLEYKL